MLTMPCHYCRSVQQTRENASQIRCARCGKFLARKKPKAAPVMKAAA